LKSFVTIQNVTAIENDSVPKRYKGKSPSPALSATKKIYDVERAGSFGQIFPRLLKAYVSIGGQVMKDLG